MASRQDDPEAGPSGLTVEDMLALLDLDTFEGLVEEDDPSKPEVDEPSLTCEEVLGESDEDDLCNETLDRFERQRDFQAQLLQQSGGALDSSVAPLTLNSNALWINRVLAWVSEKVISRPVYVKGGTSLSHRVLPMPFKRDYEGPWIKCYSPHRTCTIKTGSTSPSVPIVSPIIFKDGNFGRGNGVKEELAWMLCLIVWPKLSTATNNLKWTIRFNCPSPKSIMPLRDVVDDARTNRVMPHFKH